MMSVWKAVLIVILITASIFDVKYKRIPNWLVAAGILLGIIASGSLANIAVRTLCVICLFFFGMTRLLGFGDIKLLMVIAYFLGPVRMLISLGIAALIFVIVWVVRDHRYTAEVARQTVSSLYLTKRITRISEEGLPFAPCLLVGGLVAMFLG